MTPWPASAKVQQRAGGWRAAGGGNELGVYYAQIRFRGSREWLTVAKAESRKTAFEYAAAAFDGARDDSGRAPIEVRVLTPSRRGRPARASHPAR
jgi:hypothetical protein